MKRMINRILEKIRHSQVGSATIEAVVSFTGFLFVIFTILNIVNICRAQMLVSNAMDTVTKELTQYSYFYQISGLRKFDQEIQAIGDEKSVNLNNLASSVGDLYNALGTAASSSEEEIRGLNNSLQEGSLTSDGVQAVLLNLDTQATNVTASIEKVEAQIGDVIDNPVTYLKSIIAVAGSQGLDILKSHVIAAPLAKSLMVKHFGDNKAEANAVLEQLGIVGGLDGMNFTRSTIFHEDHPDEIHLAVYYKVKVIQLFKWADFEATICKETRARAWLGGDDVEFKVVAAISDAGSTGGGEAGGSGETSSVEGDDEEGTEDDEDSDSHTGDTGLEGYLASVDPYIIEGIKQSYDTSGWTEAQWREAVTAYLYYLAMGSAGPTATPTPMATPLPTATPTPTAITVTVKNVQYTLNNRAAAWTLPPTTRGLVIEQILAEDEYKEWNHCGALRGGYYPVIDFIKDSQVVNLKTIDLTLPSYQGDKGTDKVISYIKDYANRKLPVEGEYTRILDVRVPAGTSGNLDMDEILRQAEAAGIDIKIEEF